MKKIFGGILVVALFFGLTLNLFAEENSLNINPDSLFLYNNWYNPEISFLSSETAGRNINPTTAGWLNLVFGLGSFLMGDVGGGISVLAFHAIGWGAFIIGVATGDLGAENIAQAMPDSELGNALAYVTGISVALGVVWGFIVPQIYQNRINANRTARIDDLRNWNIGLVSNEQGIGGQIIFNAHF